MAKFAKEEAISRLEKLTEEYSKANKDNPTGLVSIADQPNRRAVIATQISYTLLNKILYVLSRSEHEYWIRTENNNVVLMIVFY